MISLFVIMHYSAFVLVTPETEIEESVANALAPFDEDLEVEPYRVHLNHHEVRLMAKHFKIAPANLHELARMMPEWTNSEGGVDRKGLYHLSTCNPDGYWDWYEIGGRWHGYIPDSQRDTIKASALADSPKLGRCLPYYVLTPEGEWIEHMRCYLDADWKNVTQEKMKKKDRLNLVRDTLQRWPDHLVVCVDIHS